MEAISSGRSFLGIGRPAPPPSGPEDSSLALAMGKASEGVFFRWRVELWSLITCRGPFDWLTYERKLRLAKYTRYATVCEMLCSFGYFGRICDPVPRWFFFAVAGYWLPFYGKSAMQHELFHAAQDQQLGGILQDQNERVRSFASRIIRDVTIEVAAHFWGGPLIGLPFLAVLGYLFYLIADETVQWVRVLSQLGWPA